MDLSSEIQEDESSSGYYTILQVGDNFSHSQIMPTNSLYRHRKYKLRGYVQDLATRFRNAKQMRDYGKSITWPRPPLVGRKAENGLKRLFQKWRAYMLLRKYPRSEWPQLRLQVIAASALKKRRKFWGHDRKWQGNYLSQTAENSNYSNFNASINNMKNSESFKAVLFSSFVKKFNKCNKSADRAVILTDTGVYKLDGCKNKFRNMKRSIGIKEVSLKSVIFGQQC